VLEKEGGSRLRRSKKTKQQGPGWGLAAKKDYRNEAPEGKDLVGPRECAAHLHKIPALLQPGIRMMEKGGNP